jgi:hypothetical protein
LAKDYGRLITWLDRGRRFALRQARDGTILKGHEVCELARRRGLDKVFCLEYDLNEAEALFHGLRIERATVELGGLYWRRGLSHGSQAETTASAIPAEKC